MKINRNSWHYRYLSTLLIDPPETVAEGLFNLDEHPRTANWYAFCLFLGILVSPIVGLGITVSGTASWVNKHIKSGPVEIR